MAMVTYTDPYMFGGDFVLYPPREFDCLTSHCFLATFDAPVTCEAAAPAIARKILSVGAGRVTRWLCEGAEKKIQRGRKEPKALIGYGDPFHVDPLFGTPSNDKDRRRYGRQWVINMQSYLGTGMAGSCGHSKVYKSRIMMWALKLCRGIPKGWTGWLPFPIDVQDMAGGSRLSDYVSPDFMDLHAETDWYGQYIMDAAMLGKKYELMYALIPGRDDVREICTGGTEAEKIGKVRRWADGDSGYLHNDMGYESWERDAAAEEAFERLTISCVPDALPVAGSPSVPQPQSKMQLADELGETAGKLRRRGKALPQPGISGAVLSIADEADRIKDVIAQDPSRAAEARKVAGYYLPTAEKLADEYAGFAETDGPTEAQASAMANIEETLSALAKALPGVCPEKPASDFIAYDADAEATAMRTMLSMDGMA